MKIHFMVLGSLAGLFFACKLNPSVTSKVKADGDTMKLRLEVMDGNISYLPTPSDPKILNFKATIESSVNELKAPADASLSVIDAGTFKLSLVATVAGSLSAAVSCRSEKFDSDATIALFTCDGPVKKGDGAPQNLGPHCSCAGQSTTDDLAKPVVVNYPEAKSSECAKHNFSRKIIDGVDYQVYDCKITETFPQNKPDPIKPVPTNPVPTKPGGAQGQTSLGGACKCQGQNIEDDLAPVKEFSSEAKSAVQCGKLNFGRRTEGKNSYQLHDCQYSPPKPKKL